MKATSIRLALLSAALLWMGCPQPNTKECAINTDCASGEICSSNKCVASLTGGGAGGGTVGGGTGGGDTGGGSGGGATGGGSGGGATGGGTGGGATGGGTGGGAAGGGTGGGATGGGTGGGATGGGAGGGATGGGGGDPMGGGGGDPMGGGTGGGAVGGGGGATGGGGGATGGGGGAVGGGGGATGGGGGATGGGGGDPMGGGGGATGGGGGATGGGGGATGGGGGATGGGGGATGGGTGGGATGGGTGGGATGGGGGTSPVCNDGTVTTPETCDDGNTTSGDGCSSTCQIEGGYSCSGMPSTCTPMTLAGGETCTAAIVLPANTTVASTTTGATNDYAIVDTGACAGGSATTVTAPDSVYRATIPANSRMSVRATSTWDMTLNVVAAPDTNCGGALGAGMVCLSGSDSVVNGSEVASVTNPSGSPVDIFILIDGYDSASSGAFTLSATTTAMPAGDVCSTAVAITGNQTLGAQPMVGFGNDYASGPGCATGSASFDRVYSVNVPAGNRLTAAVTPDVAGTTPTFNPSISIVSTASCSATLTCVMGANGSTSTGTDTVIFDNVTSSAASVFVVIDTSTTTLSGTGTFNLTVDVQPVTAPVGEVCASPGTAIAASTVLANQTFAGYVNNYASNGQTVCRYSDGPDRTYALDLPAGQVLTARAIPVDGGMSDGGTVDVLLSLVDPAVECGSGPCLSGSDTTGNATETVTQSNLAGTSTRRMLLVVDTKATGDGPFNLDITMNAPPAGETCANAGTPLTASTTLPTESLVPYASDFSSSTSSSGCTFASGQDRVYAVTIPAMNRMTVLANSTGDLALNVVDGAAAACTASPVVCAARADVGSSGNETVSFSNSTAAPKTVFVIVDRFGAASGTETFSFALTIAPLPMQGCASGQTLYQLDSATSLGLAIPDNTTTGVSNTLTVPASVTGTIAKAWVRINVSHAWDSDLDITLTSPMGPVLDLTSDNGSSGDNYTNTILDSSCTDPVTGGTAPFTGCYTPEASLTAYNGQAPAGAWVLTAADDAAGDLGTVNNWSLMLCLTP